MDTKYIQHLYWRAGFGINPNELSLFKKKSKKEIVTTLFRNSKKIEPISVINASDYIDLYKNFKSLNKEQRKKLQKMNRKKIRDLNITWIQRLCNPHQLLRERMTLFWANHFVCKDNNILHFQQFNNLLRTYALGNFRDFVKAVSKSASMLKYLNAKQNKKQSPNENFARELMELFTLGIGHYSENDIKESAKAFTGWNHKHNGAFILRKRLHDYNEKTFLGTTGNFTGEDIIDKILDQKQCAFFICEKIYKYFVNTKIHPSHIDEMVKVFYPTYDIAKLMNHVFLSKWFYNQENRGTKIKSPIDLLVGIHKVVPIEFKTTKQLIYLQKLLGQQLLNPINVAGWKMGRHWIDTNSLMFRLKLPSILLNNAVISLKGISEFEDTYEMYAEKRKGKKGYLKITQDWDIFQSQYSPLTPVQLQSILLSGILSENAQDLLKDIAFSNAKDYCIQLMSLPEYQLC